MIAAQGIITLLGEIVSYHLRSCQLIRSRCFRFQSFSSAALAIRSQLNFPRRRKPPNKKSREGFRVFLRPSSKQENDKWRNYVLKVRGNNVSGPRWCSRSAPNEVRDCLWNENEVSFSSSSPFVRKYLETFQLTNCCSALDTENSRSIYGEKLLPVISSSTSCSRSNPIYVKVDISNGFTPRHLCLLPFRSRLRFINHIFHRLAERNVDCLMDRNSMRFHGSRDASIVLLFVIDSLWKLIWMKVKRYIG